MSLNHIPEDSSIDVVGIGNAIVDVLVHTQDSFLEKHSLEKGSMTLINQEQAEELSSLIEKGLLSSGGSAANTLTGLSQLGNKVAFIGRVRNDHMGKVFTDEICSAGALFETPAAETGPPTARCIIFVTPDAQRTMCTFLGASVLLEPEDLDLTIVQKAKILYLEGYLWDDPAAKKAFIQAAKTSKDSGRKVALSLSDAFCVERHRESFLELLESHVDILFANESELTSLYKGESIEMSLEKIKKGCDIAALTFGEKGSVILHEGKQIRIKPYKLGQVIDTTGAGDLYASGFLHGYLNSKNLSICGNIGSICAGQIVTQLGPRSRSSLKELLKQNLFV